MVTVAEAVVDILASEEVPFVAGIPGSGVMDYLDALYRRGCPRFILVRHEQVAAHMALGYAELTGRPAAVLVSRSPGASNTVIGVQAAYLEGSPLVLISSQVSSKARGLGAFQEIDLESLFRPITKLSVEARAPERVPELLQECFRVACSGRPGPVHLSVPLDFPPVQAPPALGPPSRQVVGRLLPDPAALEAAAEALGRCERPVILAGGGVTKAGAAEQVLELASLLGAAVLNTWEKKAVAENDPCTLGNIGRGGSRSSAAALRECDLVLAVGVRFSEFATEDYRLQLRRDQHLVQVDVDPATIGRVLPVSAGIAADAAEALRCLIARVGPQSHLSRCAWRQRIGELRAAWEREVQDVGCSGKPIGSALAVRELRAAAAVDAVVCTDSGNFNYVLARHYPASAHGCYIYPAGAGPMGCGLPAAMGVKAAFPERQVIAVAGDGGFAMTMQDLETCVREQLDVVVVVMNNFAFGNIKVRQRHRFDSRFIGCDLSNPDFGQLARLFGAHGETVTEPEELRPAFARALAAGRPAVVDVHVDPEEMSTATVEDWWES